MRNDAKYKLFSTARSAISNYEIGQDVSQISVYGTAGRDGNVLIDLDEEIKKVACPPQLQNKRDAYALNLCSRRLGNVLPPRSILYVDPQEPVGSGDIAVYYISESEAQIVSIRENENGQLYGVRWKPDEKINFNDSDIHKLHRVVFISL